MIDLDDLVARVEQHQRETWPQTPVGRYSAERALLERDVAEVEFRIRFEADEVVSLQSASAWDYLQARTWSEHTGRLYLSSASDFQRAGSYRSDEARERYAQLADCQAWLVRAKAVLG